ncbi:vWA domain-containing protein [Leminorella richardii]|nr:VWA domain-containing protein [Leminorella richardii]
MMNLKYLLPSLAMLSASAFAVSPVPLHVNVKTELASPVILENSKDSNYLKVSLTGYQQDTAKRTPINLALVIDRSTSMSGDRIEKAREAAILAVNMLQDDDIISIIAYDNDAHVLIPATKANDKKKLIKIINDKVTPQGWTALFAGVSKGLKEVNKNLKKDQVNRIILLSDGQANVGPSSTKELADLGVVAAKQRIAVTTIGLGTSYNEDLMTALASYSDGNHAFVEKSSDLEAAFIKEFKDVMSVVAQEVTVTIRLQDGVKPLRLLGREGDITGNQVTVKLNQLYSNQEKYVLLELEPPKGKENEKKQIANVSVTYENLQTQKKDNVNNRVDIAYSKSEKAVKDATQEEIVVDSAIQKANLENVRAIQLLDEGKKDEANQILQRNAASMGALYDKVSSPEAKNKALQTQSDNSRLADDIESKGGAASRKSLKESTYKTQKQQSK